MSVEVEARHAASDVDRMPASVLGIVLFICSEAVFFSALFAAWFTARSRSPRWPPSGVTVTPTIGAIVAVLLIISSVAVGLARMQIQRGDVASMQRLLWLAVVLAAVSLAGMGLDLSSLNFTISNASGFGTTYWTIEIVDMAHVAGAAIFGLLVFSRARAGFIRRSNHDLLRGCEYFWHFVVGLSIFTFFVLEVVT